MAVYVRRAGLACSGSSRAASVRRRQRRQARWRLRSSGIRRPDDRLPRPIESRVRPRGQRAFPRSLRARSATPSRALNALPAARHRRLASRAYAARILQRPLGRRSGILPVARGLEMRGARSVGSADALDRMPWGVSMLPGRQTGVRREKAACVRIARGGAGPSDVREHGAGRLCRLRRVVLSADCSHGHGLAAAAVSRRLDVPSPR